MSVDTCDILLNGNYFGELNETSVSIGDSVVFQCTCPNSAVQWKLNGDYITNNTHHIIDVTNGTLTILAVRSYDNGNYFSCDSNNISLTVRGILNIITYNLYAYLPIVPNITITGHYTSVKVGNSVSINCTTVLPIPNGVIKWQSSSFNSDSNELIINPVMLSYNNKTFTCVVSSELLDKNLTKDITITVLG